MEVRKSSNRVISISQVPNVYRGVLIIISSNQELSWDLRVPLETCASSLCLLLILIMILAATSNVIKIIIRNSLTLERWLSKVENSFVCFKIPDDNLAIFTGTCQNMRDDLIPTDRCNLGTLMVVGGAWLENIGLLDIVAYVLDKDF